MVSKTSPATLSSPMLAYVASEGRQPASGKGLPLETSEVKGRRDRPQLVRATDPPSCSF